MTAKPENFGNCPILTAMMIPLAISSQAQLLTPGMVGGLKMPAIPCQPMCALFDHAENRCIFLSIGTDLAKIAIANEHTK